jgi:hypothetical protein
MRRVGLVAGTLALAVALWLVLTHEQPTASTPGEDAASGQAEEADALLRTASTPPTLRGLERQSPAPRRAADVKEPSTAGSPARGRVIDEHGEGVGGARVVLFSRVKLTGMFDFSPMERKLAEVTTATDGSFELAARAGSLLRAVDCEGWSRSAPVAFDQTRGSFTLRVCRRPAVAGVVLGVSGKPAAGTPINVAWREAGDRRVTLDTKAYADGTFEARVPPEVTVVDVRCGLLESAKGAANAGMGATLQGVTVPHTDLVFRLRAPAFIRGVTVAADGSPLSAHILALAAFDGPDPAPRLQTQSDKAGVFVFGPLRPETRWRLIAMARAPTHTYTEQVVAAPAEAVEFRLTEPSVLTGRLIGTDVSGFSVQWSLAEGPEGARGNIVTVDAEGAFRIEGLPAEPVRLYARKIGSDDYGLLAGALPGPTTHEIHLTKGLVVDGECKGYSGRLIFHQGELQHECRAENGRFRMGGLPPGPWVLRRVSRLEGAGWTSEWETGESTEVVAGDRKVTLR